MEDKNFFVRINNAEDIRKNSLELSKDIILTMKRYHTLKKIRKEKKDCTEQISKKFKEIEYICKSMNFSAPELGIGVKKNNNQLEKEENQHNDYKKNSNVSSYNERNEDVDDYEEKMKQIEQSAAQIEKKLRDLV